MFTEVFLNYNCMSLPHFRTVPDTPWKPLILAID